MVSDFERLKIQVSQTTKKMYSQQQYINTREYRRGNQKWTIQRNWQHRVHKTKTNKTKAQHNMCWTPLYVNTNNVNKTWTFLQTTRGKDEPNIMDWKFKYKFDPASILYLKRILHFRIKVISLYNVRFRKFWFFF